MRDLLPTFLFKWNATITMTPDIAAIKAYAKQYNEESFLLHSFKGLTKVLTNVELVANAHMHASQKDKGTKQELLTYLEHEIGTEIEFAWMTSKFFMQATLKTEELGKAIKLLSMSKLI
jgi:hypothetical protein